MIRIKPPFGSPAQLLKYLGAYINRTAVSPGRFAYGREAATVTLHWWANAEPDTPRATTMTATAFLLRFAQHILPPGFHRIRFRGWWSTAHRAGKLALARRLLVHHCGQNAVANGLCATPFQPRKRDRCPHCGLGYYQRRPGIVRRPRPAERRRAPRAETTSNPWSGTIRRMTP